MNPNELEIPENNEIKDNDEEDDKLEEKEISAQLNIMSQNQGQAFNQIIKEDNYQDINTDSINNNYINEQYNENNNEETNINNNGALNDIKSIFENPILQTSYNLFTKLRRIIIRKENLTKINYFDKWQRNTKNISDNSNNIDNNDFTEHLEDNNV